jgi:AraC-like DNA-binding protein
MSVKLIIGYLHLLNRVVQHEHISLSERVGVELWQHFQNCLSKPTEHELNAEQYVLLLRATQDYFTRPVALVLAEYATLQDFGLMGYLASTSLDLQQALELLQQYYPLLFKQTNLEQLVFNQFSDEIQIAWGATYPEYQELYELNLALLFKIAQSIVQDTLVPPQYVQLGYMPHYALYQYERFYGCQIVNKAGQYAICFPTKILTAKSIAADQQLNQVLSSQAQQSLKETASFEWQQQQFKQKIVRLLELGLNHSERLQGFVAQQLHCSERTLQRDLKQYDLNFQEILDEYRMQKSMLYLQQGKSLVEIAERLDYADQSAFGRAFKRWTGQTPRQYKES